MKVGIIGAGASGITSAILLARKGYAVTVFEKNHTPLKKVSISGNGRCNFMNNDFTSSHYHSEDTIPEWFTRDNKIKIFDFMHSIGVVSREIDGYFYPYSNSSTSMVSSLLSACEEEGVQILTDTEVLSITRKEKFILKTNYEEMSFDKVVLATGSIASLKEESNPYYLATSLGHHLITLTPALVPFYLDMHSLNTWSGVRHYGEVSLYQGDILLGKQEGEIQFTDYGISGICVMNLSTLLTGDFSDVEVGISFLPQVKDITSFLEERSRLFPDRKLISNLEGCMHYKLAQALLKECHIPGDACYGDLDPDTKSQLIHVLREFRVPVTGTKQANGAQVMRGGITLKEVKPTMESNLVPGLFLTGEILDICGDCGGFNLGFAWLSGILVAENL